MPSTPSQQAGERTLKYYLCGFHGDFPDAIVAAYFHPFMQTIDGKYCSSTSVPYETREALISGEKILDKPCPNCGAPVKTHWLEPMATELRKSGVCHTCHFWLEKVEIKDRPNVFRVDHTHYITSPDQKGDRGFSGFGGREFRFKRIGSEEVIVSHNTWFQGEIPKRFQELLPDNATFA